MKVIDFNARLAAKKEAEELNELRNQFFSEIWANLTREERSAVADAIQNGDKDKFLEITSPIIMRNAIVKANCQ